MRYKKTLKEVFLIAAVLLFGFFVLREKIAVVLGNLGHEAYTRKDFSAARKLNYYSLKIFPTAEVYYNQGCFYQDADKPDLAKECFQNSLALDPDFSGAEQALAMINPVSPANAKTDLRAIFNSGIKKYNQNDFGAAEELFKQVIARDQDFAQAYAGLGDICFFDGRIREAGAYYKQAIRSGGGSGPVYNNLGIVEMHLSNYAAAARYLKKAGELNPGNINILYSLASTLRDQGEYTSALALYERVDQAMPDYPNLHNDLGGIYQQQGLREKAKGEFSRELQNAQAAIVGGEDDAFTLSRIAEAYNGLGQSSQAKDLLDDLIARSPDFRRGYYLRSQAHQALGEMTAAQADLNIAQEIRPEFFQQKPKTSVPVPENINPAPQPQAESRRPLGFSPESRIYLNNGHVLEARIVERSLEKITVEMFVGNSFGRVTFDSHKVEKIEPLLREND